MDAAPPPPPPGTPPPPPPPGVPPRPPGTAWPPVVAPWPQIGASERALVRCRACGQPTDVDAARCARCGRPIDAAALPMHRSRRAPAQGWIVGAIVLGVVGVVLLLAAAFSGDDDAPPVTSGRARVRREMNAAAPAPEAFGVGWQQIGARTVLGRALVWKSSCSANPVLAVPARHGRIYDYVVGVRNGGASGHTWVEIRDFGSDAEAQRQYAARLDPSFWQCIVGGDVDQLEYEGGTDVHETGIAGAGAGAFQRSMVVDNLTYRFRGSLKLAFIVTSYAPAGQYLVTVSHMQCCVLGDVDAVERALQGTVDRLAPSVSPST